MIQPMMFGGKSSSLSLGLGNAQGKSFAWLKGKRFQEHWNWEDLVVSHSSSLTQPEKLSHINPYKSLFGGTNFIKLHQLFTNLTQLVKFDQLCTNLAKLY